jgi:hypothetical protein
MDLDAHHFELQHLATPHMSGPMHRMLLAVMVLSPASLSAQVYTRPDSAALERAAAFAEMTHWVETSHGVSEHSVMLRNNSRRPIQILSYEVYECINIPSRTCKVHQPGPIVEPGKTKRLVVIRQQRSGESWSYNYRFTVAYLPQTMADTARQ